MQINSCLKIKAMNWPIPNWPAVSEPESKKLFFEKEVECWEKGLLKNGSVWVGSTSYLTCVSSRNSSSIVIPSTLRLLSQTTGKEHKLSAPAKPEHSNTFAASNLEINIACRTLKKQHKQNSSKRNNHIYPCILESELDSVKFKL